MGKAKAPDATPREWRHFTAEFKLEAVRRAGERRAAGVPLTQVAHELGVTDDLLRGWRRQVAAREGAPPADVFPGNGRRPSDEEEVRRLKRELARGPDAAVPHAHVSMAYVALGDRAPTSSSRPRSSTRTSRCPTSASSRALPRYAASRGSRRSWSG